MYLQYMYVPVKENNMEWQKVFRDCRLIKQKFQNLNEALQ